MTQASSPATASAAGTYPRLFSPFAWGPLALKNRIVMAPMTRGFAANGVPGQDVAAYYRRRAEGGVALIITEGTWIPHHAASNNPRAPRFYGEDALQAWRQVVAEVHAGGSLIMPQLWHVGLFPPADPQLAAQFVGASPSGILGPGQAPSAEAMTQRDIDTVISAYVEAAASAQAIGCDGLEIHAAHGYLIDQFFWAETNRRTDAYGGDIVARTRLARDIIGAIRRRTGADFPISLRFSQWKQQDYQAKLAHTPAELERFLEPLVEAGVDIFHCSTRRFWQPEFAGSTLNLAGWTKKITGKPTITVGSVALDQDFKSNLRDNLEVATTDLSRVEECLARDEFDLVAFGRSLISNPDLPHQVREHGVETLRTFRKEDLQTLV